MIDIRATTSLSGLDGWRAKLAGGVAQRIATRSARRQQARAREMTPVQTGALHVSISVQTPQESDYAENVGDAEGLRPTAHFFPEPPPPAADTAVALVGAEYGQLVNTGTLHLPARPFWDAAALETEAALGADAETEWRA